MSTRRRILLGVTAGAALAAGVGLAIRHGGDEHGVAGGELPADFWDLRFARPDGGELALAGFRHRPLLLNFWATWCPPCVRELPDIDRFARGHAGQGLSALALAVDAKEPVLEFIQRTALSTPVGLCGPDCGELLRQLGNTQGALPFTVLLGRDGSLRRRKLGETHHDELVRWFNSLPH